MIKIESVLKENNYRITCERITIFEYLKTKHIFSANDIQDRFKEIGRASIFRTLNLFLKLGIIRKVEIGERGITYEYNDENHHHEHMTCSQCKKIIDFDSGDICKKIFEKANTLGFQIDTHNIGIIGTCKECSCL